MGRRRWRFIAVAAFLLAISRDAACQDENDFYYTPVERSFAQVQPPLYTNNRPSTFFEHGDNYRLQQPNIPNAGQQQLFSDGNRFPSPNYNQHPSPFQLPTGRSQPSGQYYINQPDFTSQRQRFRPSLPHNFQILHQGTTRRPDTSQIHSVAYQNDPSKPETFLGQITLNNPDIDFLQSGRYKNTPFDGNSLKPNNHQNQGIHNEDDPDSQDIFENHRVTTYNPNKYSNKQRLNIKSNSNIGYIPHAETYSSEEEQNNNSKKYHILTSDNKNVMNTENNQKSPELTNDSFNEKSRFTTSTEYKPLLDIEPLLEDDISDITSFRELMKSNQASSDVQVIKAGDKTTNEKLDYDKYDNNPSASSMNADNVSKEIPLNSQIKPKKDHDNIDLKQHNNPDLNRSAQNYSQTNSPNSDKEDNIDDTNEEVEDEGEYVEYYDDPESTESSRTTSTAYSTEHSPDIYDEYDNSEEENAHEETTTTMKTDSVPTTKTTIHPEDSSTHFVDTTIADHIDHSVNNESNEAITQVENSPLDSSSNEETSAETPSILGQEIVSVVTTKSVVNGTISIPDFTYPPTTDKYSSTLGTNTISDNKHNESVSTSVPNTTENWVVIASVQTSRSVSGARFLPFPTVEQEEKKQVLTEDEEDETVTKNPKADMSLISSSTSTENINDKLDSIQSELSSAVLTGSDDKNIAHITESTSESTTSTTTAAALNLFTLKSTQATSTTEKSSPAPLPVIIKKFTPKPSTTSTTTPRSKKKPTLVTVMDDLAGFLPPGYKPRPSYKDRKTSTTTSTSTTTTTTPMPSSTTDKEILNGTQGRSSGISSKNKVIVLDEKSLIPKDYKRPSDEKKHDVLKIVKQDDLSKFLPPGYKPPNDTISPKEIVEPSILDKIKKVDVSDFLPKDFKVSSTTPKATIESKLLAASVPVDISAFLPSGYNKNLSDNTSELVTKIKVADISSFLPPGFKLNKTDEASTEGSSTTTKSTNNGFKVVFPTRSNSKANRKTTTPKSNIGNGPEPITPKILKGWPTRASTEFTGWPSPSTTPFSIEKLLEAQRNATATSPLPELSTEATTRRIITTTTTTPSPPPPTTPGICRRECDIAGTIKIVSGVEWVPELLDHHTDEWQKLANEVKQELNSVYSKSDLLKKWYKGIHIDAFSKGSVLVDYFVELNDVNEKVDTLEFKKLFHKSLSQAKPGSVVEIITEVPKTDFDPDVMLGDQPVEDRLSVHDEKITKTIDKSSGKLEIGKFIMDPAYTEFIVLPKREVPTIVEPEEESFLPQWGIAVIVIALASLLFVIIFGVTVLVNRQKSAKAKQPIPLSEDMLRELDKSHMGGFDEIHQMKERELPYLPSGKRMSTAFIEQLAYPNPGDSWRSEWTPQMQKYMQHYNPDSGRGSQIYGGNGYGYSGSQIYGQTGGGSQIYGYTGEYPRSHYSRRRSEYDNNF